MLTTLNVVLLTLIVLIDKPYLQRLHINELWIDFPPEIFAHLEGFYCTILDIGTGVKKQRKKDGGRKLLYTKHP
jgi:hypothetical protein